MIFGCPTYMGGPSAQFKAFADASSDRWERQRWESKLCAGFTVGSNPSGDQLATLQYMTILAAQHGMLWAGIDIPGGYSLAGTESSRCTVGLGFAIYGSFYTQYRSCDRKVLWSKNCSESFGSESQQVTNAALGRLQSLQI